jgi:hypothetical protein
LSNLRRLMYIKITNCSELIHLKAKFATTAA